MYFLHKTESFIFVRRINKRKRKASVAKAIEAGASEIVITKTQYSNVSFEKNKQESAVKEDKGSSSRKMNKITVVLIL